MSLIKRISIIDKAILTATGNSTCICGSSTDVLINTSDMITVDGTPTREWSEAGSMAVLDMLSNSTVLYAELLWYSTVVATFPGAVDVRSIQDNPILLKMPNGDIKSITPDNGQDFVTFATGETVRFRSANVTSLIGSYFGGNYTVSMIPTSIPPTGLNNSRCAWSLNVVYRNDVLPPKKIDFMSGIAYSTGTVPYQTTISGFTTPSNSSNLKGQMLLTVANGLPLSGSETVSIGPSLANLTVLGNPVGAPNSNPLTAPNNPYNNFFAASVNNCNPLSSNMGLIDIRGTNGTHNNDAFVPLQVVGARNKWDMTGLDISNTLVPNQTQLGFQLVSGQYSVQIMSIGTQIEAIAPDVVVNFEVYNSAGNTDSNVDVGEKLLYVIDVENNGLLASDNVTLLLNPGSYASVVPDTLRLNDAILSGDITSGVNIGSVASYGLSRVTFEVYVNSLPPVNPTTGGHTITNAANYSYQFISGINTITNSGVTNSKTLNIEEGNLTIVKSVSSLTPTVGNTITYTNVITNTGTQTLSNVVFQDIDTLYTSFVPNSVYINDVLTTGLDPNAGFSLSNLAATKQVTVKYSVTIDSPPQSGVIKTSSVIKYSYLINDDINPIFVTEISNIVSISVQYSKIMKTTCANTNYPKVGDTVTYTTNLTNVGNIPATNVLVKDTPITGTTFVDGSVTVSGTSITGVNPYTGFILSTPITAGQTTAVKYNVLVNSLPTKDVIDNKATVPFQYTVTTEQGTISDTKISNTVETLSYFVCMAMTETVSRSCATIGDTIYYTMDITNAGNIGSTSNFFSSSIQSDTTFVAGSVTINGAAYPSYNPSTGFNIGSICAGNTAEIVFAVTVNSIPSGNIVYNQSNLSYSYLPNPTGNPVNESITSNRVQTTINQSSYTAIMSVDKGYAIVGDSLVYTAILNNTGSTDLYNIKFSDNLPVFVQFVTGTVYVNGINYPAYNPEVGFNISLLHPGDNARVVFAAKIISVPSTKAVINKGVFDLSYQTCSDSPVATTSAFTNEVRTLVIKGSLSVNKSTNKSYAVLNDIINYSFDISNNGNVQLTNVLFSDNIVSSLQFVTGSVIVNNVSKPDYNPITGFAIGTLNIGQSVIVSFSAKVITVPNPNIIANYGTGTYTFTIDPTQQPETQSTNSNTVTTVVNNSDSTLTKQVDKAYAIVNDILNYTLVAQNIGTVDMYNVNLKDIIPTGATFVDGSVIVNGISQPTYNPNTGFAIPTISAGGSSTINFKAKVTSIPNPNTIINNGTITYNYKLSPSGTELTATRTSNNATTIVNNITVSNVKSVDKQYATSNDILTYTSVITNSGSVDLTNVVFNDLVPSGTTFQSGSVKINGVSQPTYDPNLTFPLGTISSSGYVTVEFKVKVTSLPASGFVVNKSTVNYNYKINPEGQSLTGVTSSNEVTTYIIVGSLSITKKANREYVVLTGVVNYSFVITNTGNTTLSNISFIDAIQSESTFNTGSVYVNGVTKPTYNPNTGFVLPDIAEGQFATVSFDVTVNSIPPLNNGALYNTGTTNYYYYVDPQGTPLTGTKTSNQTVVMVRDTIINPTKYVDKSIAKIGDEITYSFDISNIGNVEAYNVVFQDTLQSDISFVEGSVIINGTSNPSANPSTGFPIPNIAGPGNDTVSFKAKVISRPTTNIVYNFVTINYDYQPIPTEPPISATITTNTVETFVATGELTITKAVDKAYSTVGEALNYSVVIKNTGAVNATNLNFKDLVPTGTTFRAGSVIVNGTSQPTFNPNTGFNVPDLVPNANNTVAFVVDVTSLPVSGKVDNYGSVTFSYKLTPTDPTVTTTTNSNTVTTYINIGVLNVTKAVDKAYATINDIVTYTFNVSNSGNVVCKNVLFSDIVQSNAVFVAQSVTINDNPQTSYNPNTGFNLPDINAGATVKIVFKVQVNTLPSDKILYNSANVSYQYYVKPDGTPITTSAVSNTVQTIINVGSLSVVKAVDKAYATVGDTITYTVDVTNTGTVNALTVNFRDVIKTGLTFVTGSVTIGGVSYPSYNPYDSFTLGLLTPGQSVQVKFNALVTSIPTPNTVTNTANIIFSYYIDPNGTIKTVQTDSNTVTTTINVAKITLTKAVDKSYATANEVLSYSFVLTNTGNVDLSNVIFTDNLQSDIKFNVGSVVVNNVSQPSYDPTVGFNLGAVATLAVINISFTVTVISAPTNSSVINSALATFSYKINPTGETYTTTTQSNTAYTTLVLPSISGTKIVDLAFAVVGNTLNYAITIKNTGNYLLTSVNFMDTLSNGGTFIAGSVLIDGVSYPSYNPITGFNLPNIGAGNTTKVQFQTTVALLPSPPVITNYAVSTAKCVITQTGTTLDVSTKTNEVTTAVVVGSLSSAKSVDKMYARVGDTVSYTTVITNTGNVTATSLFFKDILQAELTFVSSSIKIGGVAYPSLNPNTGFSLSDLASGNSITVSFDATINALPVPPLVNNNSTTTFKYKVDPNGTDYSGSSTSNTVTTNVVKGQITAIKSVDKSIATIGDDITYTVVLTNTGNVAANDIIFTDTPSTGATFKIGSVMINNVSQPLYNPTQGFSVPSIAIGGVATIVFKATVVSIPQSNTVTNTATVSFSYVVDPKQPPYTSTTTSNTVTTNISVGKLEVTKAVDKSYATIGDKLTYTITIKNVGNINATNVQFLDPTPANTIFVTGSVTVNGTSYIAYNPEVGFNLGTIVPGQTVTVGYQVQVVNLCTTN